MLRVFCNGCGAGPLAADDVRTVSFREALLPGAHDEFQELAVDQVTVGHLCLPCCGSTHEFLSESSEEDARLEAADVVLSLAAVG